jgi:hypothetical protein
VAHGPLRAAGAADFLILGYALWMLVSLAANGQADRITEWGASQFIDTLFAYLLGRAAIRNREDFYFFTRVLLWMLIFLLPSRSSKARPGG